MIIHNFEQGSPEWFSVRLGKVTASRFKDVLSNGRNGNVSKTRLNYSYELLSEILTYQMQDNFVSQAMQYGIDTEPEARKMYEFVTDTKVDQVGFVERNSFVGCSPDGLIGKDGLIEIKCPRSSTQLAYFLNNELPDEYKYQVHGQLWVCEREWCDFVSYDPRNKTKSGFFKLRVNRDEEIIQKIEKEVSVFVEELQSLIERAKGE